METKVGIEVFIESLDKIKEFLNDVETLNEKYNISIKICTCKEDGHSLIVYEGLK